MRASREFLYADDCAEGILLAAERYDGPDPVNLGTGHEIRIVALARKIADATGFTVRLTWDPTKPDGLPRRWLDVTRARELLGFAARTSIEDGLAKTVRWFETTC